MKAIKTLIALLAFISFFTTCPIAEDDPEFSDTDYWRKTCQVASSDYYVKKCTDFMAYVNSQLKKSYQTKLTLQANIKDAVAKAQSYQTEINKLQVEIDDLQVKIDELKVSIDLLQEDIDRNEKEVEALQAKVLNRMKKMQSTMHFNPFLDFLMGAKSFNDLITRSSGVRIVMNYDSEVNTRLKNLIEQLTADKILLEEQKAELDTSMEALEEKQYDFIAKKLYYKDLEAKYMEEYSEIGDEEEKYAAISAELKSNANLQKYSAITTAAGWVFPIPGASKSAGTWNYASGGVHEGVDIAIPHDGRSYGIYAPGNGVVAYTYNGCSTGYLGNTCGFVSGGGNMVGLIVSINNDLWGIVMCHIKQGSITVKQGDIVLAGEKVAEVGSTGNSSGPHSHIEVIWIGSEDDWSGNGLSGLANYASNYNGSSSFGAGWKTRYNHSRRCDEGYGAPCKVRPERYFGL